MAGVELYNTALYSDGNLKAYWRFEGNSTDEKATYSGTDTNITYSSGNGKFGQGAGFNGSSSKIDVSTFAWDSTNMTINMWVNVDAAAADRAMMIHSQNGASTPYWEVGIDVSGSDRRIEYQDNVAGRIVGIPDGGTLVGAWHMVTVTKSAGSITVYINTVSKGTGTGISGNSNASNTNSSIGYDRSSSSSYYKGALDDLACFDRVLSGAEISSLYAAGPSNLKTFNGLATASVKTINGLAIASVKSVNGLT